MSISVNGQSQVPPGFRFHPTEEELLHYYLNKKISSHPIDLDVIQDLDLNKIEPWDIQDKCRIGSAPQNDWYFFSHKDKKYPTGTRTNRATASGFWKATGRDKVIYGGPRRIGMRKTLVFYTGRAPHGLKSDWIMHEYRLDSNGSVACDAIHHGSSNDEAGWVVCRVFRKKNHGAHKPHDGSRKAFAAASSRCGVPAAPHNSIADERFLKLPSLLESYQPDPPTTYEEEENGDDHDQGGLGLVRGWAAFDRLVACHLNCQPVSGAKLQVPSAVAREVHEEHSGSNLWVGGNIREGEADDELLFDGGDGLIWSFAAACSDDNLGNMAAQHM